MPVDADVPISEQIARVLKTRLEATALDYAETDLVVEVVRPLRHAGWTPQHKQIILTQDAATRVPELDCPGNPPALCWSSRFNIRCHVMPSESSEVPLDQELNYFLAGVRRAVTDAINWETFDGLSINALWGDQEKIAHDGSFAGINQPLDVIYKTSELSGYVLRT